MDLELGEEGSGLFWGANSIPLTFKRLQSGLSGRILSNPWYLPFKNILECPVLWLYTFYLMDDVIYKVFCGVDSLGRWAVNFVIRSAALLCTVRLTSDCQYLWRRIPSWIDWFIYKRLIKRKGCKEYTVAKQWKSVSRRWRNHPSRTDCVIVEAKENLASKITHRSHYFLKK